MDWINESTIGLALGIISSLAGGFKLLNVIRKRNVATAIYHAYNIVNDLAAANKSGEAFNKSATALRSVDSWMIANGWRTLKPNEQELALLSWKSRHGSKQEGK
jgi:hypothetical protein